jgi:Photosynthesis affected mutant 68
MAAKAKSSQNESRGSSGLPFEPKSKPKSEKTKSTVRSAANKSVITQSDRKAAKRSSSPQNSQAIPEVVSRRMAKRMLIFSGIPTLLGLSSFPASYFIFSSHLIELPNVAVLLVSLGFFGLGVLGLSYGVLSASWDEDQPGSALGITEFKLNLGRTIENWKLARQRSKSGDS